MSVGQSIIDSMNNFSHYKIPKRIKVTTETYNWLMLDERLKHIKIDEDISINKFNSLPVVIDDTIKGDYEIEY